MIEQTKTSDFLFHNLQTHELMYRVVNRNNCFNQYYVKIQTLWVLTNDLFCLSNNSFQVFKFFCMRNVEACFLLCLARTVPLTLKHCPSSALIIWNSRSVMAPSLKALETRLWIVARLGRAREWIFLCLVSFKQQQQCIYLKKYKVYNTLCPANSYKANLGRTRLYIKTLLNYIRKKKRKEIQKTYRKKHITYKFQLCFLPRPVSTEEPAPEIGANLPRGAPTAISGPRDRKNGRESSDQWWYSARPLLPSHAF